MMVNSILNTEGGKLIDIILTEKIYTFVVSIT